MTLKVFCYIFTFPLKIIKFPLRTTILSVRKIVGVKSWYEFFLHLVHFLLSHNQSCARVRPTVQCDNNLVFILFRCIFFVFRQQTAFSQHLRFVLELQHFTLFTLETGKTDQDDNSCDMKKCWIHGENWCDLNLGLLLLNTVRLLCLSGGSGLSNVLDAARVSVLNVNIPDLSQV